MKDDEWMDMKWLDGPPPETPSPHEWPTIAEDEGPLQELPATKRRNRARRFSLRWGWIFDIARALLWWFKSWWTREAVFGIGACIFAAILVGMVLTVGYYSLRPDSHLHRTFPTVEQLNAEDGSLTTSRKNSDTEN